jgi:G6PDH family F420-dependent oxidoreductase
VTGDPWPPKPDRRKRLEECVGVIRRLWAGETVDHDGLVRVKAAKLYSRPDRPPRLFGAAITEETAEWAGSWADGLITVAGEPDDLQRVVAAFRRGGGIGKPVYAQAAVGFAADDDAALAAAVRNWPVAALDPRQSQNLAAPADFDRAAVGLRPEALSGKVRASADLGRHIDWLRGDFAAGVDAVYLHHVGPDPERFIRTFAQKVLPKVGA